VTNYTNGIASCCQDALVPGTPCRRLNRRISAAGEGDVEKQTGTNNVFDEALKDLMESRRARARLAKNHRTLAASVRNELKVRESAVGRLPACLFPVSTHVGPIHDDLWK
jgi:hypothetical protein